MIANGTAKRMARSAKRSLLFTFATAAAFASNTASVTHQLRVEVRPQALLTHSSADTLLLKIRLAPNTQALLWNAATCNVQDPAAYSVSSSGTYTIPTSALPGPTDSGTCLRSTDGALQSFAPPSH